MLVGSGYTSSHAQLLANAGRDTAWCSSLTSLNPLDTPRIGGYPAATGGVQPYTYSWAAYDYLGGPALTGTNFLEGTTIPNPKFRNHDFLKDSVYTILRVQDAAGATAFDTAIVRFQRTACVLGGPFGYRKAPLDTITISECQCQSNFLPYQQARWSPGNSLVDSTALTPRSFTQVTQYYSVRFLDRAGCWFRAGNTFVDTNPVSIDNLDKDKFAVVLQRGRNLAIHWPANAKAASYNFQLLDMNGKKVQSTQLQSTTATIQLSSSLAKGIYIYRIQTTHQQPYTGKINLHD